MVVKNAFGREIEIDGVCGEADDVQIDNCYYVDGDDEVTSEDIDYIMYTYGDELYGEYMEQAVGRAEDRYDLLNDREGVIMYIFSVVVGTDTTNDTQYHDTKGSYTTFKAALDALIKLDPRVKGAKYYMHDSWLAETLPIDFVGTSSFITCRRLKHPLQVEVESLLERASGA